MFELLALLAILVNLRALNRCKMTKISSKMAKTFFKLQNKPQMVNICGKFAKTRTYISEIMWTRLFFQNKSKDAIIKKNQHQSIDFPFFTQNMQDCKSVLGSSNKHASLKLKYQLFLSTQHATALSKSCKLKFQFFFHQSRIIYFCFQMDQKNSKAHVYKPTRSSWKSPAGIDLSSELRTLF